MSATYYPISFQEMYDFLTPQKFGIVHLPGTVESVFSRPYRHLLMDHTPGHEHFIPVSLRVYTGIAGNTSRNVGDDAIRVQVWLMLNGEPKLHAVMKRVHRVTNWRLNLQQRLDSFKPLLEPFCTMCGAPCRLIKPKNGAAWKPFYSCVRYPECKGRAPRGSV